MEKIQKNNLFSQIVRYNNEEWEKYCEPTYLKDVRCLSYNIDHMLKDTLPKFEDEKEYSKIFKQVKKCKVALITLEEYFKKYESELDMPEVKLYEDFFKQN